MGALRADDTGVGPNLLFSDFETGDPGFNPWSGVDDQGNLHVNDGYQLAVNDVGRVLDTNFSPSVAVGDLNGDGLPDLVVADARGFFWYYANSGKPDAPVFTVGEVMPLWFSDEVHNRNVVPRFQLVDYVGDKKLHLVVGTFAGQLFLLQNRGTPQVPSFHMPNDLNSIEASTRTDKKLWCNYLSPFLYDWSGTGRLDLIMGDGSYSANSIYLYTNQGSNTRPRFDEKHRTKIIAGMGREHLTPQVVDWNGDGKPDIICGERNGYIDLYLNKAADKSPIPTFDYLNPQHVQFGTTEKIGTLTTVCAADLNNDKKFDLVISDTDGRILYSLNTGTADAPKFAPPVPFKGTYPYKPIATPKNWVIDVLYPYGAPFQTMVCTNAKVEPGFTPPPDFKGQGAAKFFITDPHNKIFRDIYTPSNMERNIVFQPIVKLTTDTKYIMSFWIKTDGDVSNFHWHFQTTQLKGKKGRRGGVDGDTWDGPPTTTGSSWNFVTQTVRLDSITEIKNQTVGFRARFQWEGTGTVYLDGISLKATK